jgi:hypothetical protein
MNVPNEKKLPLKDMPAEEIKAILNSDRVEIFYSVKKGWEDNDEANLCAYDCYRTKPLTISEQLESQLQELQKENARLEAKATNHHEMMLRAEGEKLVLMQENARLEGELDKHIRAEKALMVGNIINCDMMSPNDLTPPKPKG